MTHTYDIRVNVPNGNHKLLPGMVADVSLYTGYKSNADAATHGSTYTLPVTAVQRRADGSLFVWTIDKQNKAHRTTVTIGQTEGNRVFITDGLAEGQQVVVEGYQKLSEGTRTIFNS